MTNQKIVALSYTKQRTMFGLVGIEVDAEKKIAYVGLAKQWKRDTMNDIPKDMAQFFAKVKWDQTFADQLIGQHLIRSIEQNLGIGLQAITTQKNLKDPENIEKLKVMDMVEMTQLTLSLKQEHQIQWPPIEKLKGDMDELTKQMEMFTEHVTEQGTVAYFAPGKELDCLPRALMICLFVARAELQHGVLPGIISNGSPPPKTFEQSENEFLDKVFGTENYSGLAASELNRGAKKRLIFGGPRQFDF